MVCIPADCLPRNCPRLLFCRLKFGSCPHVGRWRWVPARDAACTAGSLLLDTSYNVTCHGVVVCGAENRQHLPGSIVCIPHSVLYLLGANFLSLLETKDTPNGQEHLRASNNEQRLKRPCTSELTVVDEQYGISWNGGFAVTSGHLLTRWVHAADCYPLM